MSSRLGLACTLVIAVCWATPVHASEGETEGPSSTQARERGGLQLGIGSVLAATGIGLVAFGAVEFTRAQDHLEFCLEQGPSDSTGLDTTNSCSFDPPPLGFTSAGLSWGLSIPLLVGAGMLLARGATLVRGPRESKPHANLYPWWQRSGGGLTLRVQF